MATKKSAYDDTPSKKNVGLVVMMTPRGMLQFPEGVKYCFESINGTSFLVVFDEDGKLAHVNVANLMSVHGPTTLFRDGRWK